jgi:hypothetical protein
LYNKLYPGLNLTTYGFNGPRVPRIKAVFNPPEEPYFHYNTSLGYQVYPYRLGFYYNPEICAIACTQITQNNMETAAETAAPQYTNGAYDKCNMFTSFELHKNGIPHALVCVHYSAIWANQYGTWTGDVDSNGDSYTPSVIEVYTRADYQFSAICADPVLCLGDDFYAGGDCSGWGATYCNGP